MVAREVKVAVLLLLACSIEASVLAPAVAPIAYTKAVPYNVLPFANSVNVFSKVLSAPVPIAAPAYPAYPAPLPAVPAGVAPAPAVIPALRVSSFLPAPFSAAPVPVPAVHGFPAAPAVAAPVVRSLAPAPFVAPAYAVAPGYAAAPAFYSNAFNPAFGRAVHAVPAAPFAGPVVPAAPPVPNW